MKVQLLDRKSERYLFVESEELIQGFLAKLPNPQLAQPKGVCEPFFVNCMFREVAQALVGNNSKVDHPQVDVNLDDLTNPALAIFLLRHLPRNQGEESIFVYQKVEGRWIDKTPSDTHFDRMHCLTVQCDDDLDTVLTVSREDPMWINLVLYRNDPMCEAWLKLKLLLHKQDGSAITSLMQSKDGPVRGHTVRITRSIETAVVLIERQMTQWYKEEVRRSAV